jgi:hypothetical protein
VRKPNIKQFLYAWFSVLSLLAVLSYFSSSLFRYHWPTEYLFVIEDKITQTADYQSEFDAPKKMGPLNSFQNKSRIIEFSYSFRLNKVSGSETIFDIGGGQNKLRMYLDKGQLRVIVPGGLKRSESIQDLVLIKNIQTSKKYQVKIQIKTGVFIHIFIDNEQVLDLDEPGPINGEIINIGSNLDRTMVLSGEITSIKVREVIREVRTSRYFQGLFWAIFILGACFLVSYNQSISNYISRSWRAISDGKLDNFLWKCSIIVITLNFLYYVWFFLDHTYLPSPFTYGKSETFTDYFHTLIWAYREDRYSEWHSVYPPLIFLVLKWVTPNFYIDDVHMLRAVSYWHIVWIIVIYLLIPLLVLKTRLWFEFSFREKLYVYVGIILSISVLFALERGNFIFIAPLFIALLLSYPKTVGKLSFAILANLKPYFFVLTLSYLLKRQWRNFFLVSSSIAGLFLLTGIILDKQFYLFFYNLLGFNNSDILFTGREIIGFPSSISSWPKYLRSYDWQQIQLERQMYWPVNDFLLDVIEWIKIAVLFWCLLSALRVCQTISLNEWFLFFIAFLTNLTISLSGYSLLLYYPFIPIMLKMQFPRILVGILLLIQFPWDWIEILHQTMWRVVVSFRFGFENIDWVLGAGSIARPILNLLLLCMITYSFTAKYKSTKASFKLQ